MQGTSAVVGVGESTYYKAGKSPYSAMQMACTAIRNAVEDAGLSLRDIDGLVTFNETAISPPHLAGVLGFGNLRFTAQAWGGGGNQCAATINLADSVVTSGQASHVVVYRSLNQGAEGRYGRANSISEAQGEYAYLTPFGMAAPAVRNALLVKRFLHLYDIPQDALAEIALADYAHAQHNPRAIMHGKPLTREAYHASRWIAEPFHLFDCCQENDGACAVVVTTAERARDLAQPPAYILAGCSGMEGSIGLFAFNDSAFPNGRYKSVGERLWAQAGIGPHDVDVAQFYENFTGMTLMAMSDIGFAPPEGIAEFVSNGNLQWPMGRLPLNTSGGNIAEAYIHGLQLANEAVRQVRGQSTCQVKDVSYSLFVSGPGHPPSSAVLFSKNI